MGDQPTEFTLSAFFFLLIAVCVFCLHVCLCPECMSGACGSQKRVLDPLKLQLLVSHRVGAENQPSPLLKRLSSLQPAACISFSFVLLRLGLAV